MLKKEEKQELLQSFLRVIEHIFDKEYQRRVWIRTEGPEVGDFDENVCLFFDMEEPIFENYKDFDLTDSQYLILKKFSDEFETFVDDDERPYLPEDFIDSPEWEKIRKMAEDVLKAFNYEKRDH